jgi:hypothetical protein
MTVVAIGLAPSAYILKHLSDDNDKQDDSNIPFKLGTKDEKTERHRKADKLHKFFVMIYFLMLLSSVLLPFECVTVVVLRTFRRF